MREIKGNIQHRLWEHPWAYAESFLIGFGLVSTGFLLEMVLPDVGKISISYPYNVLFLTLYILLLFIAVKRFLHLQIIRWLIQVPAAVSSMLLITFMVMIMGVVPQVPTENTFIDFLGLNQITHHWAFLWILFQFLTSLGLVTAKRILEFKWTHMGFILNHLGLFITLTAGLLASGDLQRISVNLREGAQTTIGIDEQKRAVTLPFSIRLEDFSMEEYPPEMALVSNRTGVVILENERNIHTLRKGAHWLFRQYEITVIDYLPSAGKIGERFAPVNQPGSPPAALVSVKNLDKDTLLSGWITCGSFSQPYKSLKINKDFSMVMTVPDPKKFSAAISLIHQDGMQESVNIMVNKPYSYKDWKIYQLSYNERMGKWSDTTVLELVRDPWLPVIYTGIFMMIAGAVHLFWTGTRKPNNKQV